jgi:hypothetical protein
MANDYPNYDGTHNCARMEVEIFYQDYDNKTSMEEIRNLKEFCSTCNILIECSDYAIKHEKYGFWGGTTPHERRTIRSKNKLLLDLPETRVKNNGN